ncbi:unnamed protein product [Adineta ricciae]|uniref:Uncharacterized protein n=1 Tax=Adineta ricciae TaxID=249248 RepID=A0A814G3H5_ADIRI|nr:unnamed protein product [Adineta ricciae]
MKTLNTFCFYVDTGDASRTEQVTDDLPTTLVTTTDSNINDTISPTNGPSDGTTADTSTTIVTTTTSTICMLISNLVAIYDATAGSDSTPALSGSGIYTYPLANGPSKAFDKLLNTSYRFRGFGTNLQSGINSGFYVTYACDSFIFTAVRFASADASRNRDPIAVTIEGSDETTQEKLGKGDSWHLLYSGSTGLYAVNSSMTYGNLQKLFVNASYKSYRVLVTEKRGSDSSVEYSEIKFFK